MSTTSNLQKVQEMYAAFGRGDVPSILKALAPDVTWTVQGPAWVPLFGTRRGREGAAEFFQAIGQHLTIEEFAPREFIVQGDHVVVLGFERGRTVKSGGRYEGEWAHVFTFRNGLVVSFKEFSNTAALAEAFKPNWSSCPAA